MTLIISSGRNASYLSALPRDQAAQVASQSPVSTQTIIYGALNQLETALLERFQGGNNQVASLPALLGLVTAALLPFVVRSVMNPGRYGSEEPLSERSGCPNRASTVCRGLRGLR